MAADSIGLLFRINADSKQATQEVAKMRGAVTREVSQMRAGAGRELDGLTNSLTASTGGFGRMASAAGPAGIALSAVAGAALLAGGALFSMARSASLAIDRVRDLSVKTGLTIETLSGLELAAAQQNTSIETLGQGILELQKRIEEALDGNERFRDSFRRVGIDIRTAGDGMDATFRQLVAGLSQIPSAAERNAIGFRLMGRQYRELSLLINSFNGDIEKTIEHSRRLGLTMTTEQAQAADRFNDSWDQITRQLGLFTRNLGGAIAPEILRAMNDISAALARNQVDWKEWGSVLRSSLALVRASALATWAALQAPPIAAMRFLEVFNEQMAAFAIAEAQAGITGASGTLPREPREARDTGADREASARRRALDVQLNAAREMYQRQTAIAKREYDLRLTSLQDYTERAIQLERENATRVQAVIQQQEAEARRSITNQTELQTRLDELRLQSAQARLNADQNILRLQDDLREKEERAAREHHNVLLDIVDERAERETVIWRELVDDRVAVRAEAERRLAELDDADYQRRIDRLRAEREAGKENLEAQQRIDAEISRLAEERANRAGAAAARVWEAEQADLEERVVSREEAEQAIARIEEGVYLRRLERLQLEFEAARENLEERQRVHDEILRLADERATKEEQTQRRIARARREDLEDRRRYEQEARERDRRLMEAALEARRLDIEWMIRTRAHRRDILRAEEEDATARERLRHQRNREAIIEERRRADTETQTAAQRLENQRRFNEATEIEEIRHTRQLEEIREESRRRQELLDPSSLRSLFGDTFTGELERTNSLLAAIAATAQEAFASIGEGVNVLSLATSAMHDFAGAIGSAVENWVLFGTTGPAAMRKMVASVLAGLAAQAAVKAVFELAEGSANLARAAAAAAVFDVKGAALFSAAAKANFNAALIYGSIAGVAAVAGRAIAGDSFNQGKGGAGAGAGRAGARDTNRNEPPAPIQWERQPRQQTIVLRLESNDSHIVRVINDDVRNDGQTRVTIIDTARGG